jgi:hypothetical protein
MTSPGAKIIVVNATELKPDSRYIFVVDSSAIDYEDMEHLLASMRDDVGIKNPIGLLVRGEPKDVVKIIEQEPQLST